MCEVLEHYKLQIEQSDVLVRMKLERRGYFIVSLHREENVDSSARLSQLVDTLDALAAAHAMPVIVSTHPRTRKRLDALSERNPHSLVKYLTPFGFHDYNQLQMNAFCAISDSGTIAEEASILGFPAITPRDAIERPEGLDTGCIIMTGLHRESILDAVSAVTAMFSEREAAGIPHPVPADYCITNTSERVVNLILGTARLSNSWDGIRANNLT